MSDLEPKWYERPFFIVFCTSLTVMLFFWGFVLMVIEWVTRK